MFLVLTSHITIILLLNFHVGSLLQPIVYVHFALTFLKQFCPTFLLNQTNITLLKNIYVLTDECNDYNDIRKNLYKTYHLNLYTYVHVSPTKYITYNVHAMLRHRFVFKAHLFYINYFP